MTVTAPPRPPQPSESARYQDPEALIEEARERQRRRRRRYAAATVVLMLVGLSGSVLLGAPGPSQSVDAEPPPRHPAAADQDEAATLIAHHWEMHRPYVLIYDDGRAIVALDRQDVPTFERRLTPAGVELVRSGAVEARAVLEDMLRTRLLPSARSAVQDIMLTDRYWPRTSRPTSVSAAPGSSLPAGAWADSEFRTYEPSRYAVCPVVGIDTATAMRVAISRVPAAAALLRGKERTYANIGLLAHEESTPVQCFELSTAEIRALRTALSDAGAPGASSGLSPQYLPFADGIDVVVQPILPHGEPVAFYG